MSSSLEWMSRVVLHSACIYHSLPGGCGNVQVVFNASWSVNMDGQPYTQFDHTPSHMPSYDTGYAYIYVSNEQAYLTDVYFDDITVTFTPTPVIQQEDFYPFGLTFNSYQTENSLTNYYLYMEREAVAEAARKARGALGSDASAKGYKKARPDDLSGKNAKEEGKRIQEIK